MLDKWPAVAYNADTPTCFLSSSHATQQLSAMLYMVTDRDILWPSCNGHGICTTHSDIMPPRIDAPRSADLLYTVVIYRYTVLTVGKHEDHCLRSTINKSLHKDHSRELNHHCLRESPMYKTLSYRRPLLPVCLHVFMDVCLSVYLSEKR